MVVLCIVCSGQNNCVEYVVFLISYLRPLRIWLSHCMTIGRTFGLGKKAIRQMIQTNKGCFALIIACQTSSVHTLLSYKKINNKRFIKHVVELTFCLNSALC